MCNFGPPAVLMQVAKFKRMGDVAKKKGLHLIPESHIGTAIIKADCENDCNPRRKPVITSSQRASQSSQAQLSLLLQSSI